MKVNVRIKPSAFKSNLARDAYTETLYQENRDLRRKLGFAQEEIEDSAERILDLKCTNDNLWSEINELRQENEELQNAYGNICAERDALINEQEMLYKKIMESETVSIEA